MLLSIGNVDFTKCIVVGSYAMNKVDEFKEFKDASGVVRRYAIRQKMSGTVNLYFRNDDYKQQFTDVIKNKKDYDGSYLITAKANNTDETVSFRGYVSAAPARNTVGVRDTFAEFTVTIEEQ